MRFPTNTMAPPKIVERAMTLNPVGQKVNENTSTTKTTAQESTNTRRKNGGKRGKIKKSFCFSGRQRVVFFAHFVSVHCRAKTPNVGCDGSTPSHMSQSHNRFGHISYSSHQFSCESILKQEPSHVKNSRTHAVKVKPTHHL